MRWILCGKNDAAVVCLEHLVAQGDEVWVVATHGDDGRDGWQRSLRGAAERLGVRVTQPARINAPDVVAALDAYDAAALISIQYDQILHGNLFRALRAPCLNLHFALLPRHRGVAPVAWAILAGDTEAGVTLHYMVEDIDAGDVIAQRAVAIDAADTARALYEKLVHAAGELFVASYPFPPALLATRLPQDATVASYHRAGDFDFRQRRTDWDQPAATLHRWLRAMIFPPMQYPETGGGRRLVITTVAGELGGPVSAPAGSVLASSSDAVEVATADRSIRIRGMLDLDDPDRSPADVMRSLGTGARLA